jgi:hypothetical protein
MAFSVTDDPPLPEVAHALQRDFVFPTALAAHTRQGARSETLMGSLTELGTTAVQAALAINGGAAVAVLAICGALMSRDTVPLLNYADLTFSTIFFGAGVLVAAVAAALAYVGQLHHFWSSQAVDLSFELPKFTRETECSIEFDRRANRFVGLAAVAMLFSYLLFAAGSWEIFRFADHSFNALQRGEAEITGRADVGPTEHFASTPLKASGK